jgi:ABC-type lipoprotein release transport system permease subunit
VGKALADRLKVGVDDRISLVGRAAHEQMRTRSMTIIGIYDIGSPEIEKSGLYITLAEAQSLYGMDGQVTEIAIALRSVGNEVPVVKRLQAALPGREVASWMELNPDLLSTYAIGEQMIDVFALIVLLIAGIGILNLMLMAVFERTREIGLLAAMGLKSRHILGLFVLEGALIGLVGALIGCTLGAVVSLLVGINGIDLSMTNSAGQVTALLGSRLYPVLSADALLRRGITVVIIAALAALYPAWQAAHREPAESLHYV